MKNVVGKYELGRVLGSGDFDCRTNLCTHIHTGANYAVRIYDKRILAECQWMWDQISEAVQVMRTIPRHENIIEMVECFETQNSLYILMQMHSPRQVTKMYTEDRNISVSRTREYFIQIVRGIHHLQEHGVVHLGLAPDHIMINDVGVVKIGYLVSCKFHKRGTMMNSMRGTTHTVAPEVLRQEAYDPYKADSWSLGVVLHFMLGGGRYPHDSANATKNILQNKMRPLNPSINPAARDLVAKLVEMDPDRRITVQEALDHPWLSDDAATEFDKRSIVESTFSESDGIRIVLPRGLSKTEEAAFIIQHTWRVYKQQERIRRSTQLAAAARVKLRRAASLIKITRGDEEDEAAALAKRDAKRMTVADAAAEMVMRVKVARDKHRCKSCGRLPPPRVGNGRMPYPSAHLEYKGEGQFKSRESLLNMHEMSMIQQQQQQWADRGSFSSIRSASHRNSTNTSSSGPALALASPPKKN